ncbi:hypothetical protein BDY19DRAFT_934258 [Irpex rosettiformis]|uniref:Uncharacterized protein n=1 Tax=Irpex rosettiformis TaxID=378272 RepID=A0ACB8UAA6_9APHY|nr:hypothetical protein BDY19DRAFT_934258 [Irpex rosettiformis]
MHIVELPDDVLLHIALELSIEDILSFKQTCRVLHAFGTTDYLWHRLAVRSGLLLNIPTDTAIATLSADELQRVVIDAMRLEANWTRADPKIKRTTSLYNANNALFEHLQFVEGGKWLLVVQDRFHRFEERAYTKVSFWSLHNIDEPHCVVQFELTGKCRASDVALQNENETVTFVVALTDGQGDFFEIRTFSLNSEYATLSQIAPFPSISRRIDLPASPTPDLPLNMSITSLSVSGKILAATVTVFNVDHHEASRILVTRTDQGPAYWMQKQPYKPIHPALTRLHKNHIVIFGHSAEGFACHTYELPPILLRNYTPFTASFSSYSPADALAWGPLVADNTCANDKFENLFPEPRTVPPISNDTLAFIAVQGSRANLVRFHLDVQSPTAMGSAKSRAHPLPVVLPPDTSIRLVGVGGSGRRAVWMEHNFETTRSQLMRLEVLHDDPKRSQVMYKVLLPPDPPLPFSTDACQALAFNESSCRLCFGLWDGSLHLVDFL